MSNNLELYNKVREVPKEAQKTIGGGRLKGMTDINPMWRIKTLTEQFGICGVGWKYEIVDRWIETSMARDEITANVIINLYVKVDGVWSEPIVGVGGSMLVASEKNGLYVNDECYKMSLTDALSVACKSLGMGADIYWQKDNTKYNDVKKENTADDRENQKLMEETAKTKVTSVEAKTVSDMIISSGADLNKFLGYFKVKEVKDLTKAQYVTAVEMLMAKENK